MTDEYANPPLVEDFVEPKVNLSNNDFRDILHTIQTPSRNDEKNGSTQEFAKPKNKPKEFKSKQKYSKPLKPKAVRNQEASPSVNGTPYRDRAQERREQVDQSDIKSSESSKLSDYNNSKFIGGTLDNTHLVKGLDFALAANVRRKYEKDPIETSEVKEEIVEKESQATKAILRAAFPSKEMNRSKNFLPGKMRYYFELDTEYEEPPPILFRSEMELWGTTNISSQRKNNDQAVKEVVDFFLDLRRPKEKKKKVQVKAILKENNVLDFEKDIAEMQPMLKPMNKPNYPPVKGKYFDDIAEQSQTYMFDDRDAVRISKSALKQLSKNYETIGYDECYKDSMDYEISLPDKDKFDTYTDNPDLSMKEEHRFRNRIRHFQTMDNKNKRKNRDGENWDKISGIINKKMKKAV